MQEVSSKNTCKCNGREKNFVSVNEYFASQGSPEEFTSKTAL